MRAAGRHHDRNAHRFATSLLLTIRFSEREVAAISVFARKRGLTLEQAARRMCAITMMSGEDALGGANIRKGIVGLTQRQAYLLRFIAEYQSRNGCSPSLQDMSAAFGWDSRSTAFHIVELLERSGFLTRQSNRPRSIQLTDKARAML